MWRQNHIICLESGLTTSDRGNARVPRNFHGATKHPGSIEFEAIEGIKTIFILRLPHAGKLLEARKVGAWTGRTGGAALPWDFSGRVACVAPSKNLSGTHSLRVPNWDTFSTSAPSGKNGSAVEAKQVHTVSQSQSGKVSTLAIFLRVSAGAIGS